jgi:hypothetical protein
MHTNRLEASEVLELFVSRPRRRPHRVARRRRPEPIETGPVEAKVTAATFTLSQSVTGVPVLALLE